MGPIHYMGLFEHTCIYNNKIFSIKEFFCLEIFLIYTTDIYISSIDEERVQAKLPPKHSIYFCLEVFLIYTTDIYISSIDEEGIQAKLPPKHSILRCYNMFKETCYKYRNKELLWNQTLHNYLPCFVHHLMIW